MSDFTVCNLCQNPGTFDDSLEVNQIPSNKRKFKDHNFTVWRCSSCNSLHSKENVDLNYYYEDYSTSRLGLNYFFRCAFRNRLKFLRKFGFRKDSKLLDYGCNDGLFLSFLNQLGYENVFGYDPYDSKYSEEKILTEKYDFITAYDVIEHVEEPNIFLNQLANYLAKDGLLLIGTPNADEIKLSCPETIELHQPYHRHILSEEVLINLGLSSGLEVVKFYNRSLVDTIYPAVNSRAFATYVKMNDDCLDAASLRWQVILTSPLLIFYFFAGYFFRMPGNMTVIFQLKQS